MLGVPDAQELILAETQALPAVELPFQKALQHTLAADVRAAEPVPGCGRGPTGPAQHYHIPKRSQPPKDPGVYGTEPQLERLSAQSLQRRISSR